MTIYIDVIFLENFILNFIILYATGIVGKFKIKWIKLILSSLIGALYAVTYYFIPHKLYFNVILKIILSIVMLYIAFETKSIKEMVKAVVFFYLVSFAFGGAALAVIYMVNSKKISIQNGMIVGSYTLKTVAIGITLAFITIIIAFKFIKTKFSKKDLFCNIAITINNKKIKTKAMLDTGNLLKEPITNIPVVVIEQERLRGIIDDEILDNIDDILGGDLEKISQKVQNDYISKLKVIPFSSLGKQHGMLLGLKADKLEVENENIVKKIDKVIVGIYNKKISRKNEYSALIGLDVI